MNPLNAETILSNKPVGQVREWCTCCFDDFCDEGEIACTECAALLAKAAETSGGHS